MIRRLLFFLAVVGFLAACQDDESFTISTGARLTMAVDTVDFDTLFAGVPTSTRYFWVFNHNADGVRLSSVRLKKGNQTGFRVNVDGVYLDNKLGSVATDLKIRGNDSIRVFVELTSTEVLTEEFMEVDDDLLFRLESGVEQSVHLQACAWDAVKWNDTLTVNRDTTITSTKPIIVYKGIKIDSAATLTLKDVSLYFHSGAGVDVRGRLIANNVLMRGDRLDNMFDYLPYDRVSGQWRGVRFLEPSKRNALTDTEIRNAVSPIVLDSAAYDSIIPRLCLERCVLHNGKGTGVLSYGNFVSMKNCQISNMQGDCVQIVGGMAVIDGCTLAQFYAFAGGRGWALRFTNYLDKKPRPLHAVVVRNSIVTGYDEDVVMGDRLEPDTLNTAYWFYFENSLLRTPKPEGADSTYCKNIIWETSKDSIQGKQHFVLIDETNLKYDFHLDSLSTAKGLGCYR